MDQTVHVWAHRIGVRSTLMRDILWTVIKASQLTAAGLSLEALQTLTNIVLRAVWVHPTDAIVGTWLGEAGLNR